MKKQCIRVILQWFTWWFCSVAQQEASPSAEHDNNEERERIRIAQALQNYRMKQKLEMVNSNNISSPFQKRFSAPTPRPSSPQRPTMPTSKILPLFRHRNAPQNRPSSSQHPSPDFQTTHNTPRFPVEPAAPYVPISHCRTPYRGMAPPVTIRTAVPVFSAPPRPLPTARVGANQVAQPVRIRQAIPVFSAPLPSISASSKAANETTTSNMCDVDESTAIKCLEQLEI